MWPKGSRWPCSCPRGAGSQAGHEVTELGREVLVGLRDPDQEMVLTSRNHLEPLSMGNYGGLTEEVLSAERMLIHSFFQWLTHSLIPGSVCQVSCRVLGIVIDTILPAGGYNPVGETQQTCK